MNLSTLEAGDVIQLSINGYAECEFIKYLDFCEPSGILAKSEKGVCALSQRFPGIIGVLKKGVSLL